MLIDVAIAIFVCCLAIQTAAVRIAFSMARDHALPFGEQLAHVTETRHSPAAPAIVSGIIAILVLLVNIGNASIFLVVTSVSIILVYIAYLLVTVPTFLKRRDRLAGGPGRHRSLHPAPALGRRDQRRRDRATALLMVVNLIWPREAIYGAGKAWGGVIAVGGVVVVGLAYYYGVQRNKVAIDRRGAPRARSLDRELSRARCPTSPRAPASSSSAAASSAPASPIT